MSPRALASSASGVADAAGINDGRSATSRPLRAVADAPISGLISQELAARGLAGKADGRLSPANLAGSTTILQVDAAEYAGLAAEQRADIELPIGAGQTLRLELERFEVFAPGATIIEMSAGGERALPAPDGQLWRGRVAGVEGSRAFVGLTPHGAQGFVSLDGNTYSIATVPSGSKSPLAGRTVVTNTSDIDSVRSLGVQLDPAGVNNWGCQAIATPESAAAPASANRTDRGSGVCRTIRVAIDADQEFAADFGNSATGATNYINQLMGAISTFYQRDVGVQLQVTFVRVWTTTDPWTSTTTSAQLPAFRTYWQANRPTQPHDLAHLLSARSLGGGIAYLNGLCNSSAQYGVSANLNGSFPFPVVNNNGANWDPYVVAHELGHNFGSGHTHDAYTPVVDGCGNGDCSQARALGSIMSYCHQCSGGLTNINLAFGTRPSDRISSFVASVPTCGVSITQSPITLSAISLSGTRCRGGTVTLSVTPNAGAGALTYSWYRGGFRLIPTGPSITLSNLSIVSLNEYRVEATNGCVTSNSPTLNFNPCIADFNCSGSVTVQDIFDFLAQWFQGSTAADFNLLNGVSVQDIFDFLAAWFVGC